MCCTPGLAKARADAAAALWRWGKRREHSMLSRWRSNGGGVAAGDRPWFHMFDIMYAGADARNANDWWK
eukprot:8128270-Pyramimonas_sp.AAC.1